MKYLGELCNKQMQILFGAQVRVKNRSLLEVIQTGKKEKGDQGNMKNIGDP